MSHHLRELIVYVKRGIQEMDLTCLKKVWGCGRGDTEELDGRLVNLVELWPFAAFQWPGDTPGLAPFTAFTCWDRQRWKLKKKFTQQTGAALLASPVFANVGPQGQREAALLDHSAQDSLRPRPRQWGGGVQREMSTHRSCAMPWKHLPDLCPYRAKSDADPGRKVALLGPGRGPTPPWNQAWLRRSHFYCALCPQQGNPPPLPPAQILRPPGPRGRKYPPLKWRPVRGPGG